MSRPETCSLMGSWIAAVVLAFGPAGAADGESADPAPRPTKPNILLIVADDLGYADVGYQGARDVRTPHIDSIARQGVRFTNAYVSSPVCSPTRAGLITGRYQQRFGHEFNVSGPWVGLPTGEITLAQVMRNAGYATATVGKWHLGEAEEFHPLERGFDEFFGFLGLSHPYLVRHQSLNRILRGKRGTRETEYLTDAFGRESVAFVERNKDVPFFLFLSFSAVHTPMQAPPRYVNRFTEINDARRRTYAGMLSAMDDAIGRVLSSVRANGLDGRTLVFFISDNGGRTKANGAARNDPLRKGKGSLYEGGIRVPFALRWEGELPAGVTYENPVISLDLFASSTAAAKATLPRDRPIDGVNLLPALRGETTRAPHEALFWRQGNRYAVRHGRWKLVKQRGEGVELYDLATDIGEAQDVAGENIEKVSELQKLYDGWNEKMIKPKWNRSSRMYRGGES